MRHTNNFTLLAVIALAFLSAQAMGQISKGSDLDLKATELKTDDLKTNDLRTGDLQASYTGSALTCTQPPAIIHVPSPLAQRAKLKVRLVTLLRESLYDDAKGIVNIAREKEIKKLANKLRSGQE